MNYPYLCFAGQSSCAENIHKETRSTTNTTTATKDETTSSNNVSFSNENKENFRYTPASSATLCKFCGEEPRSNNDENNYAGCLECFKTQLTINKNNSTTTPQSYTLEQLKDASHGEKRKYSRTKCHNVKFSHLSAAAQNDSSSDDEIKDLCSKYKCISSSPPNNKTLTQHASIFKHHQKILCVDRFGAPRPSLNFEKMQQVCSAFNLLLLIISTYCFRGGGVPSITAFVSVFDIRPRIY